MFSYTQNYYLKPKFFLVFTGEGRKLQDAVEKAYEQAESWMGENKDWCMLDSVQTETVVVPGSPIVFLYNITATYIDLSTDEDKDGEENAG